MYHQLDQVDVLSILLSAAIHDYDHPGLTNNFLVASNHPLAILYNDRSVLENHHVASAWKLMLSTPKFEFLQKLEPRLLKKIRLSTIELVLSTDMSKHFEIISQWKTLTSSSNTIALEDNSTRISLMQMIIKFSDISNPAKDYSAHRRWSRLVIEEFYHQGDLERFVF